MVRWLLEPPPAGGAGVLTLAGGSPPADLDGERPAERTLARLVRGAQSAMPAALGAELLGAWAEAALMHGAAPAVLLELGVLVGSAVPAPLAAEAWPPERVGAARPGRAQERGRRHSPRKTNYCDRNKIGTGHTGRDAGECPHTG